MTCWLCGFETTELATNTKALTCENDPCRVCIAVSKLDEEINQAAANLRRLLSKRCDLRSEQNRIHGSLMHRLPVELKNHIFELLLPSRDSWGRILRTKGPRSTETPSYIICRGWRDIAWSNPSLWSTIHVALGTQDPSSRINFMQDWILRSQTLPLTLHLDLRDKEARVQGVIPAITQCSNRWHSLSLDIPLRLLHAFNFSSLQCPLLRSLRIKILTRNESQNSIDLPVQLNLTANHLSVARVEGFNLEEMAQLFQHASQMTYCHIISPGGSTNASMPLITHHRLERLGIYSFDTVTIAILLSSLTLPRLGAFQVNMLGFLTHADLPALVHRSSCPLTRITFADFSGRWRDFDVLQPLPGVTELVLRNLQSESHAVIKKLLLGDYFPYMRHLILERNVFFSLWDLGVISLLLDRNRPRLDTANDGTRLKVFVVDQVQGEEFTRFWNSGMVRERLEARQAKISFRGGVFEISTPTNENSELVVCQLGSPGCPIR